jgi:hypothetical protein
MKEVIIIGHGISAFKKKMGKKINNFDEVYRFINAKNTKELEQYIGTKTTHLVVKKKYKVKVNNGDKSKQMLEAKRTINKCKKEGIKLLSTNDCFLMNEFDKERHARLNGSETAFIPEEYVKMFNLESSFKPRLGLKLIFMLLKTYKQITLYGFDIFGLNKKHDLEYGNGLQHYWGIQKKNISDHDPHLESKIILQLIKEGKVCLM